MGANHDLGAMDAAKEAAEHARIMALPAAHFGPLLALLPALRGPLPPVTPPLTAEADGTYTFAPLNVPEVQDLIMLCYTLDLVLQVDWIEFVIAQPFHESPERIDGFDRFQCCQALTALVRGERFNDGLVDGQWRKGTLARIVARLAAVV